MYKTKVCNTCCKRKDIDKFGRSYKRFVEYVRNKCKECMKIERREYVKKNREKVLNTRRAWNEKNRDKINQQRRDMRRANIEETRKYNRQYYEKNKKRIRYLQNLRYINPDVLEKKRASNKKYLEENKNIINAKRRKKYRTNPDYKKKRIDAQKKYYADNKSVCVYNAAKRRKLTITATPPWQSKEDVIAIRKVFKLRQRKSEESKKLYHVDHIVPLYGVDENGNRNVSGLHVPWNLRVITQKTNRAKSNFFFGKWIHPCVRTT